MDLMPLAYKFLSTKTYNCKGAKTVCVEETRNSWNRHKCTVQVCIYADGVKRCNPLCIFERAEKGGKGEA